MSIINLEDFLSVSESTKRLDTDFHKDFKILFTSHLYSFNTWPQAYSAKHHKLQDAKDAHRRKHMKMQEKINREAILKDDEKYDLENLGIDQMSFNPGCESADIFIDIEKPAPRTAQPKPVSAPIEDGPAMQPIDTFSQEYDRKSFNEEPNPRTSAQLPPSAQNYPPSQQHGQYPPIQPHPQQAQVQQQVNPGVVWYQNWIMETAQRTQTELYNCPPEKSEYLKFYLFNLNFFLPGPHFNEIMA